MHQILLIVHSKVKVANTYEELFNKTQQTVSSLYKAKEIAKNLQYNEFNIAIIISNGYYIQGCLK